MAAVTRGSVACARFRLGSPRFHEPEDHADVAESLIGQRTLVARPGNTSRVPGAFACRGSMSRWSG